MSICLIGKSCSGKDTVTKELISMGYEKIITYTTRPQRNREIDGIHYHFISEKLFKKMIEDGVFAEWREYKTKSGTWYYGSLLADYRGRKKVIILTPDGYKKIQNIISNNKISFKTFYLRVSNRTLKKRMFNRDSDKTESKRRYKADKKDFRGIKWHVDYVIDNEHREAFETALICKEIDENEERYKIVREY